MFTADELRIAAIIVSNNSLKPQDWKSAMHAANFCEKADQLLKQAEHAAQEGNTGATDNKEGQDDATEDAEGNAE
jgi:hypothetical protein